MMSCGARGENGTIVTIGLSDDNCRRLLADDPIFLAGERIGLPDLHFAICKTGGRVAIPREHVQSEATLIVVQIEPADLAGSVGDDVRIAVKMLTDQLRLLIFRSRDDQKMYDTMQRGGLIGAATQVTIEGLPPDALRNRLN
jgi:hypothetical protein